ncbi:MAG TPA: PP2C family serine/threonine-protein phosphatase [Streptosporangiaceae bacterium]|nr:PP2C family serine/threonine-protein phosphatase [Streptosporangiaceae bacterium]
MTLELRYAVRSDVGLLREGNEDSAYAGPRLLAVADGMGGHAAGEVASALTIASMAELDAEQSDGDMLKVLAMAVAMANARLQEKIIANPAVEGMGTTLTALLWSDGHAAVCHIGDSRGYLLREGELYQITHDHTLVQSLVDEGRISADDVSTHPQRSLLLRALDGRSIAEPDLSVHESLPGDRYLLCSDGLSGVVSDETLRDTLSSFEDPETAARQLIDLAIHGGGPDNITCIVADVVDTATTRLPLTTTPVLAGAAALLGDLRLADGTGPFGIFEDHHEDPVRAARTAPQPTVEDLDPMMTAAVIPVPVSENGADPRVTRARRSHRAQPRRSRGSQPRRRRWPIVTTSLVVLLAVVIGGGYIFYRVSQEQYYVAADSSGQVVIYRGINQHIAGFSWSSPYEQTGIELSQVPSNYQQTVKTAYSTGSLTQVRSTVTNIRAAVEDCRNTYVALQNWATAVNNYNAAVALAHKAKKPTNKIPKPPAQPTAAGAMCPSPAAFGIPASALAPTGPGSS